MKVTGGKDLYRIQLRFTRAAQKALPVSERTMAAVTIGLVAYVKTQKLQGQVLNQRSGKLNRSMAQRVTMEGKNVVGIVGSIAGHAPHALPLEVGSKPHRIEPVRAKALRFTRDGAVTFSRSVMHPGNRAYHYLRDTLTENRNTILDRFSKAAMGDLKK